jgi:membrane-associated phospholipid phosphatase
MALSSKAPSPKKTAEAIERADLAAAHSVASWRDNPVVSALGSLSELADQPQLYAISAAMVAAGLLRGDRRMARAGVRMFAAEWLATKAKGFIKHRVDRTRPHVPVEGGGYRMERGESHDKALNSFPSGHTAGAVAVARAYASEYPEHAGRAAALSLFVGVIQIPRCRHYPSDIGVGAMIGLAAGSLVARREHPAAGDPAEGLGSRSGQ